MSKRYSRPLGHTAFGGTSRHSAEGSNQTLPAGSRSSDAFRAARSSLRRARRSATRARRASAVAVPKMCPYSKSNWCQCTQAPSSFRRAAAGEDATRFASHSTRSSAAACKYSSRLPHTCPSRPRTRLKTPSSARRAAGKAPSSQRAAASATWDQRRTAAARAAVFKRAGKPTLSSACMTTASKLSGSAPPPSASRASRPSSQSRRTSGQSRRSAKCLASKSRSVSKACAP
mmetsp:Transcript_63832/g.185094  ORF Transcript_63832/g.185094 Transcript_63832/m.185094 type:complete len:231 (-) Transcript_63832:771-1463(-)